MKSASTGGGMGATLCRAGVFLLFLLFVPLSVQANSRDDACRFEVRMLYDSGQNKDDILSLDSPLVLSSNASEFADNEIVFGVLLGRQSYVVPRRILVWREVVNFTHNRKKHSITYCPLTGSAIGYKGLQLGVSGKLLNSNLVLYDRKSESLFPQISGEAVDGPLCGLELESFPVITTTWKRWLTAHPRTLVLADPQEDQWDYHVNPYGEYEAADQIWFPVGNTDRRLPLKERVVGVAYHGEAVAIRKQGFAERHPGGLSIVLDGRRIHVSWDEQLQTLRTSIPVKQFETYWFAWAAFFPNTRFL